MPVFNSFTSLQRLEMVKLGVEKNTNTISHEVTSG